MCLSLHRLDILHIEIDMPCCEAGLDRNVEHKKHVDIIHVRTHTSDAYIHPIRHCQTQQLPH